MHSNTSEKAPAFSISKASFKSFFNNREGLQFSGLTGHNLVVAEKKWWYDLVFDVFTEIGMIDDFDSYFEDLYEFFAKDAWEIFEDTLPFLEEAKKRDFKLIITSNFDSRIYNVCEHFGISKYIDCFTISSESGSSKPDPKFFFKSLSNFSIKSIDQRPNILCLIFLFLIKNNLLF